jgi:hypothetical protein
MKWTIPDMDSKEWLAEAIRDSVDDDVIIVKTEAAKELGERAKSRMCPDKKITFEVQGEQE